MGDDWLPRWVWVGECVFFWYQLTRVVPDKIQRAVKWLCVYLCVLVIKWLIYWNGLHSEFCFVGMESRWFWTWWRLICWKHARGDLMKFRKAYFRRSLTSPSWLVMCNLLPVLYIFLFKYFVNQGMLSNITVIDPFIDNLPFGFTTVHRLTRDTCWPGQSPESRKMVVVVVVVHRSLL